VLDGVRHDLATTLATGMIRRSDPDRFLYRLVIDPAVAADPFPLYEELRARGPVLVTMGAVFVTGYDEATALYRDNRLGHGIPPERRPWLQRLLFPDYWADLAAPAGAAVDDLGRPAGAHALPQARGKGLQRQEGRSAGAAGGGAR
jgi:hypothetical protein